VCPAFDGGLFVTYQRECDRAGASARPAPSAHAGPEHTATGEGQRPRGAAGTADPASKGAGIASRGILRQATIGLLAVYKKCRAEFKYQTSLNPRRCLTKPSDIEGDGFDNKDADLVVYVNDELVSTASGRTYVVIDKLGQGTFGQVSYN